MFRGPSFSRHSVYYYNNITPLSAPRETHRNFGRNWGGLCLQPKMLTLYLFSFAFNLLLIELSGMRRRLASVPHKVNRDIRSINKTNVMKCYLIKILTLQNKYE